MKKSFALVIVLLSLAGFKSNAQICFAAHVEYTTGTNPNGIVSGDFDQDGNKDLAVANGADNNISVFMGTASGTFGTATTYTTVMGPTGMCTGYLNGDTFLDIAFTNFGGSTVNVVLNDGSGGFGSVASFIPPGGPQVITSGDFNGDGFADLVVPNYGSGNISLFLGTGTGSFGTATNFNSGTNATGIVSADLNGDTFLDVVTANYGSNNISVLMGTGTGSFAARVNYANASGASAPGGLVAIDLDADGDKDLVIGNQNSNNLSVFLNNGNGTFATATTFNANANTLGAITTADFNNDGKPDVACAVPNMSNPVAKVFLGNGTGSFSSFTDFPVDFGPRAICAADFNGDGLPDIATSNQSSNTMSVILNGALPPIVGATALDTTICNGSTATLIGTGAVSYTWNPAFVTNGTPFTPGSTLQYTVTGNNYGCTDTDTLTVFVSMGPSIVIGPVSVCGGQPAVFNATGNAVSYTWTGGVTNGVPFYPSTSATYTVTGTGTDGCTRSLPVSLTIKPTPVAAIASGSSICSGLTYTLSSSGSSGVYAWTGPSTGSPAGTTPSAASTGVTAAGTYTLMVTNNSSGCSDTATRTVTFLPSPSVTANASSTLICAGTSVVFSGSGNATGYTWSGGVTDNTPHIVNTSQTYTVTGSSANGCVTTATVSISIYTPPVPDICRVTVDSLSQNNVIYWDKTAYPMADSFYVYRDTANNAYGLIGKLPYSALSEFKDSLRNLYAANGDPNVSSWRYKIALKDTCGTLSAKSLYHQSIFMQNNSGNFSWSEYRIEGQGTPVSGLNNYVFKRDNISTGNYVVIQVLSASSTSYTDGSFLSFPNGTWRTETAWVSPCQSTMRVNGVDQVFGAINTSRSNIKSPTSIGIQDVKNTLNVNIYPIPASEFLTVELSDLSEETMIVMQNTLGQSVYVLNSKQRKNTIDCSRMETGVYFITVTSAKGQLIRKVVIH